MKEKGSINCSTTHLGEPPRHPPHDGGAVVVPGYQQRQAGLRLSLQQQQLAALRHWNNVLNDVLTVKILVHLSPMTESTAVCAALTMAEARAGGQLLELEEARERSRATCRGMVVIISTCKNT